MWPADTDESHSLSDLSSTRGIARKRRSAKWLAVVAVLALASSFAMITTGRSLIGRLSGYALAFGATSLMAYAGRKRIQYSGGADMPRASLLALMAFNVAAFAAAVLHGWYVTKRWL